MPVPFRDMDDEPITGAPIPWDQGRAPEGSVHFVRMLVHTLREALLAVSRPIEDIAIVVALGEHDRPGLPAAFEENLLVPVEAALGVRFHPRLRRLIRGGRGAGFRALISASEILQDPSLRACVVCGVDSFLSMATLQHFDQQRRLKTENNTDGFIPGEAAAAVVLTRRSPAGVSVGSTVEGLASAREPRTVDAEDPSVGTGLASAIRACLQSRNLAMADIDLRLTDLNGERYFFVEHSYAIARVVRERRTTFPLWYLADCIGEIGAASVPALLTVVDRAHRHGYAPGPVAMLMSTSDDDLRGCALIRRFGRVDRG
ncbi:MAG: beta-ketoacyl synthase N-terminal-like domain-containing protein [Myxococcota bacterium]